eukprot:10939675-Lingulodinium_polyedra.AAC.1
MAGCSAQAELSTVGERNAHAAALQWMDAMPKLNSALLVSAMPTLQLCDGWMQWMQCPNCTQHCW